MEPNQQNQFNNTPTPPPSHPENGNSMGNGHKKVGPIIATLVIVLILIIAALYVFASRINQQAIPTDTMSDTSGTTNVQANVEPSITPVTGTDTDPAALQKDLNAATQGLDSQNF